MATFSILKSGTNRRLWDRTVSETCSVCPPFWSTTHCRTQLVYHSALLITASASGYTSHAVRTCSYKAAQQQGRGIPRDGGFDRMTFCARVILTGNYCDRGYFTGHVQLHGTVVERGSSYTGELSLICTRPTAGGWLWVNRPLQVSQLGQLCLSSSFQGI